MLRLPERNGQERTSTNHETPLRSLSSRNCHFGATRQSCNFEPSHEFCGKGNTLVKPYRLPSGGRDSSTHRLKISGNRRQISAGDRGLRFIRLLEYTFLLHLPITSSHHLTPSKILQDSPRCPLFYSRSSEMYKVLYCGRALGRPWPWDEDLHGDHLTARGGTPPRG
jgi:hypothetical protein